MKSREGFVSNSSSSSFLIVGCSISKIGIEKPEGLDSWEWSEELESKFDLSCPFDTDLIGEAIGSSDGDTVEADISIQTLCEITTRVSQKLQVDPSEIRLCAGTRYN